MVDRTGNFIAGLEALLLSLLRNLGDRQESTKTYQLDLPPTQNATVTTRFGAFHKKIHVCFASIRGVKRFYPESRFHLKKNRKVTNTPLKTNMEHVLME